MAEYYKFLTKDGLTPYRGARLAVGVWLPPVDGELIVCRDGIRPGNGYHFVSVEHVAEFADEQMYRVEVRGGMKSIANMNLNCARQIRMTRVETWTWRTMQLWMADMAERVLPIFEKRFPTNPHVRACIEARRKWARGEITEHEWDAIAATIRDAPAATAFPAAPESSAASGAARAAFTGWARLAARLSANLATNNALTPHSWDAERKWQSERLMQYVKGELS